MKLFSAQSRGVRGRKNGILAGAAFALVLAASTSAMAQNCTVGNVAGPAGTGVLPGTVGPGAGILGQMASAASAQIATATSDTNTIFQAGQGSAFVSAPANPPPDSPGGGIWTRVTGGQATVTGSSTTQTLNQSPINGLNQTTTVGCANQIREQFAGFQMGADTAKLNWNGWNIHLGTTAGYLQSNSNSLNNAYSSNFQVPFVGTYAVATYGRFFSDALLKQDFYNIALNNPGAGFISQPISGRGTSFAINAGYNFALANNWFIEPSAGFTYSRTSFDAFSVVGVPGAVNAQGANISGTLQVNDIVSEIGRASIRVGTTYQSGNLSLSPFFTASVYNEFAGNIGSSFATCPGCNFFTPIGIPPPPPPPVIAAAPATFNSSTSTSRVGAYGQYSLGIAGQIINTGWLGFARVDYRNGDNIVGWAGTAGIRYQFTPEMIAAVMPTKAPVKALPVAARYVNWTGFYIGAHGGVGYDRDTIGFVGSNESAGTHFSGMLGGGQVGYNYQLANKFVIGVEGDASWADLKGGQTCGVANGLNPVTGLPGGFDPFFMSCNTRLSWVATATAKLGYAWDRTLYYIKAGAAFADETVTVNCIVGPLNMPGRNCNNQAGALITSISSEANRAGWTLGFGAEFALTPNWSAKAEYDYIGFGSRTGLASDGTTYLTSSTNVQLTKIGLNYRFSAGPVIAKY
jgi:opacity protein-like surface antigen